MKKIAKTIWNYDGKGNFIVIYPPKNYKYGLGGDITYNCGPSSYIKESKVIK